MEHHSFEPKKIIDYATEVIGDEPEVAARIADATRMGLQYSDMLSGKVEGRFLSMLAGLLNAKRILEVGMFTGYSTYMMAQAIPEDGEVITCEMNERYRDIAEKALKDTPEFKKITIVLGSAQETLPEIDGPFDMIFLDADKENYPLYYEMLVPKLRIGGLLVIDNALWGGEVVEPGNRKAVAIDRLNRLIKDDGRMENVLLTIRDGIHLARKTGE